MTTILLYGIMAIKEDTMESKICGRCKQEKPVSEFCKSKRDGYRWECKVCHYADVRDFAKTGYYARYQKEYSQRPEIKLRNIAKRYVRTMLSNGLMTKKPCAVCGDEKVE